MTRWDHRFIALARLVASWSKDPSTKVGAVIVRPDKTVASLGYNGFPRGADDAAEIYDNRPLKLLRTVHAEANAIVAARSPLEECNLYVTPLHPCASCAGLLIQAGIKRIVYEAPDHLPDRWADNFTAASEMFHEADIQLIAYEAPRVRGAFW